MAPKKKAAKVAAKKEVPALADLKSTFSEDDVAKAKEKLAALESDAAEKRRAEANMTYYLKKSGELQDGERLQGDERRRFLLLYLSKVQKDKNAKNQASSSHDVSHIKATENNGVWMGLEQMIKVFGEKRVQRWRDSKKLEKRADPITGDSDSDVAEFKTPQTIEKDEGREETKNSSATTRELEDEGAIEEHEKSLKHMAANLVSSLKGSADDIETTKVVKTEPSDSSSNPLADLSVLSDTKNLVKKFKAIELDAKILKEKAATISYADKLASDLGNFTSKCANVSKALERLLMKDPKEVVNAEEAKRLEGKVKTLTESWVTLSEWGRRFGISATGQKKRKAK